MAGRTKKKGNTICPAGIAWAKRTFDKYPSAYANLAASKYCKDPNYAKKIKRQEIMNVKQMREVVKQLKGASKMHAQQAAKIEKMIKSMKPAKKKK